MTVDTYWARIYLGGPIEIAKQIIREDAMREGLCVTVTPTTFVYTGGDEAGYEVGLINYPRFPAEPAVIDARAMDLLKKLLLGTFQKSALLMTPTETTLIYREEIA